MVDALEKHGISNLTYLASSSSCHLCWLWELQHQYISHVSPISLNNSRILLLLLMMMTILMLMLMLMLLLLVVVVVSEEEEERELSINAKC